MCRRSKKIRAPQQCKPGPIGPVDPEDGNTIDKDQTYEGFVRTEGSEKKNAVRWEWQLTYEEEWNSVWSGGATPCKRGVGLINMNITAGARDGMAYVRREKYTRR